ncbi:hypothetical protein K7X08_004809 [Anisodus acutangulus]|uniref:Carboxypeptidase A inhibitor-like domain-containing protein n=1 Tax=Anisodus acutangulus TaxID=402998 RepID=A0A9Q1RFX2_9SOLA|nr:hypothetical protein K7X08_004809 [Anisodus acutangulus]
MSSLKLTLVTILLMAIILNVLWFSPKQAMATEVDHDHSGLKKRLPPQLNDFFTCKRPCTSDSDCSDCWTCCRCANDYDTLGQLVGHICQVF